MPPAKNKDQDQAPGVNPTPVYVGGESLADRLLPHLKKFLIGVAAFAVILSVYFTYRWMKHRKAERATTALAAAVAEAERPVQAPPATPPKPSPDGTEPPKTFATAAERAEVVLAGLAKTGGDARQSAALLEARMLFDAGRLDDAERLYGKLSTRPGIEGAIAREGVGYVAEARADAATDPAEHTRLLEVALEAFRKVQTDDEGPRRDWALYHEGRMLAALGHVDEARTVLQQALDKAGPDLHSTVELRLTRLDAVASAPAAPGPAPADPAPADPAPATP
ncbi:MAG: hypothetical protein H6709_07865 [Kofleriaceae bacterium]|nr:hypothetical protein [Myxococcales bacterium]MCB9571995.1 hypothetical protein [Kofleriaceae bacterium]